MGTRTSVAVGGPATGRVVRGRRRPAPGGLISRKDAMRQDQHDDEPGRPRRSRFRRFDDFAMRFYGPAERSPRDLRGQEEPTQQVQDWYQNLQDEFVVEKDAGGRTYLRPRER